MLDLRRSECSNEPPPRRPRPQYEDPKWDFMRKQQKAGPKAEPDMSERMKAEPPRARAPRQPVKTEQEPAWAGWLYRIVFFLVLIGSRNFFAAIIAAVIVMIATYILIGICRGIANLL
jgi:hypothetical protein